MKRIKLEEHNEANFQEAGFDKAICAFGSCESHGGHLPFGMDTFVSYDLAVEAAQRFDKTVVVPPLWYGMRDANARSGRACTSSCAFQESWVLTTA